MMKIKFKIINVAIVLGLALFLLGCGGSSSDGQVDYNFKQGVVELNVDFLDNAPPEKIYPSSNFKVILNLENLAAYDLKNGKITLVGLDEKYFTLQPPEQYFDLIEGRSLLIPAGGKKFIEFDGTAGKLFQNAESYRGNYFLKVKYDSTMEFADTVCINPNLYSVDDSGCKVEDRQSYAGQGAPLAVENVEEIIYPLGSGAKVEFRIALKNRGKGKIDHVQLESAKLGGKEFQKCEFQGPVIDAHRALLKKDKQEALLICETVLNDQSSYTTTLALDFSYDYEYKKEQYLNLVK